LDFTGDNFKKLQNNSALKTVLSLGEFG